MNETIEQKCIAKGVKLTEQRKIIAKVMSEANDHPDVDELYTRASKIDSKISIATVYRTVKLFEEGILWPNMILKVEKLDMKSLVRATMTTDIKTGEIIEFVDDDRNFTKKVAENMDIVGRNKLELYGVKKK